MRWLLDKLAAFGAWLEDEWDDISCELGRCRRCVIHSTDAGIGGRCINCSKIHGWMTRDELRAVLDGRRGPVTPLFDRYVHDGKPIKMPRAYVVRGPTGPQ